MSSDPFSAIIGGGLGTGSTIIETLGFGQSAKAEEEAAQAAALLAKEQALVESAASRRRARQATGGQRAQIGRSGVSLQGSQMDLLISNAFEMELEAVMIERFGAEAARQQEQRGKSIAKAAQLGRAAGIVNSFRVGGSSVSQAFGPSVQRASSRPNPELARSVSAEAGAAAGSARARLNSFGRTPLGVGGG